MLALNKHVLKSKTLVVLNLNNTNVHSVNLPRMALGIFLSLIILVTVFGNLFVVYAVIYNRQMRRNLTNWFLLSLALADLLMGSVVMPFGIAQLLFPDNWFFGQIWCDLWHAFDVLCSTASILNLCAIALERYWAIYYNHFVFLNKKYYCIILLVFVWTCSCGISFPAIAWWKITDDYINYLNNICFFTKNSTYLIVSSCISFYIPLIVMIVVYLRIYYITTKLVKRFKNNKKIINYTKTNTNSLNHPNEFNLKRKKSISYNNLMHVSQQQNKNCISDCFYSQNSLQSNIFNFYNYSHTFYRNYLNLSLNNVSMPNDCFKNYNYMFHGQSDKNVRLLDLYNKVKLNNLLKSQNEQVNTELFINAFKLHQDRNLNSNLSIVNHETSKTKQNQFSLKPFNLDKYLNRFAKEQKTARILAIIMGLFTGCWLPFFICNLFVALDFYRITENNYFQTILIFSTWLGYINSCLNPIIYAHSIKGFQQAFKHLCYGICCFDIKRFKQIHEHRCKVKKPEYILYKINNMSKFINKKPKFHVAI